MSFLAKGCPQADDHISYGEAIARIGQVANGFSSERYNLAIGAHEACSHHDWNKSKAETIRLPLLEAVGRTSLHVLCAPHSTPQNDTSAMDGFAVDAGSTVGANKDNPLKLRVVDSIAAGDDTSKRPTIELKTTAFTDSCVEIMTGACFPESTLPHLDSVVKIEDVVREGDWSGDLKSLSRYVILYKPVKAFQHRRPAGSDFLAGDLILENGTIIAPKHVAALASLGLTHVEVSGPAYKPVECNTVLKQDHRFRIGVMSTGSEIVDEFDNERNTCRTYVDRVHTVSDSNGPFLITTLRTAFPAIKIEHLGVVQDDENLLTQRLERAIFQERFDLIITSGGVSKGRHDIVRHVIEEKLGGQVVFHGVKIRPGAPILFALFNNSKKGRVKPDSRPVALFGAPGNPLAAAVALRFFVVPYVLRAISGLASGECCRTPDCDHRLDGSVVVSSQQNQGSKKDENSSLLRKSKDKTVFLLAQRCLRTTNLVEVMHDQASYKVKNLLDADCWITVPAGFNEVVAGDRLRSSPL